jgi:hypothetical protein
MTHTARVDSSMRWLSMLARSLLATAVLVASAAAAGAATVTTVKGAVSVNSGSGFQPIAGAVDVRPGDRVLVGEGGRAQMRFSLTCAAALGAGVHVVPSVPRCEAGAAVDPQTTGAIDPPTDGPDPRLILGGLVAVATTATIIAATQDKPASP